MELVAKFFRQKQFPFEFTRKYKTLQCFLACFPGGLLGL